MITGAPKSKIRGILGYFTRNPIMTTWMKTNQILQITASLEKRNTFRSDLEMPLERIAEQTTILSLSCNPHNQSKIQIMDSKKQRLRITKAKKQAEPLQIQSSNENTFTGMPGLSSLDNLFVD